MTENVPLKNLFDVFFDLLVWPVSHLTTLRGRELLSILHVLDFVRKDSTGGHILLHRHFIHLGFNALTALPVTLQFAESHTQVKVSTDIQFDRKDLHNAPTAQNSLRMVMFKHENYLVLTGTRSLWDALYNV